MVGKRSSSKRGRTSRGTPGPLLIRQVHGYLSAFVAPSVLFFALTGALQLFGLHEARDGYHPPALIEKLGRLHKDQAFALKPHRGQAEQRHSAAAGPEAAAPAAAVSLPMPASAPAVVSRRELFQLHGAARAEVSPQPLPLTPLSRAPQAVSFSPTLSGPSW